MKYKESYDYHSSCMYLPHAVIWKFGMHFFEKSAYKAYQQAFIFDQMYLRRSYRFYKDDLCLTHCLQQKVVWVVSSEKESLSLSSAPTCGINPGVSIYGMQAQQGAQ